MLIDMDSRSLKIVDLSMIIREGEKGAFSEVKFLPEMSRAWSAPHFKKPCAGWESRNLILPEHCATHVDAPYHFIPDADTIDKVAIDRFLGNAVLLDLRGTQKVAEPVRKDDLTNVCSRDSIEIEKLDIIILFSKLESRGLANDAVDWLVERGIKAVGTNVFIEEDVIEDGLRVRYAHMRFLSRGICIFEGLINLDKIPAKRFFFIGLPLKLQGGTGSPIRAVALIPSD